MQLVILQEKLFNKDKPRTVKTAKEQTVHKTALPIERREQADQQRLRAKEEQNIPKRKA